MTTTLTIAKTFHGPPTSGNGGYVSGRLASFIDGPAAVRLKSPPPLDCPGAFALPEPKKGIVLLGEMTARLMAGVQAAQPCIVTGWPLGRKGRMHYVATALFDSKGTCCAMARATWVAVEAVSR